MEIREGLACRQELGNHQHIISIAKAMKMNDITLETNDRNRKG